jgi:two-component system, LytTR family, sensor kinase
VLFSIVAYCGASFYFNKLRIYNLKIQHNKEKALLLKELVYFRNQFNSHVTFNFLNYCYSHIHKNSPEAAKAIELYSDMLRYSSDNLSESKALLKKEIVYLNKYIGLRKLLNKKVFVKFKVQGGINGKQIYPRLLLTFIENAFKHGIYNDPENPVEIEINSREDRVSFTVVNKIRQNKNMAGTGTGLINARQLLQLHYPGRHSLKLAEYAGQYRCTLELDLNP